MKTKLLLVFIALILFFPLAEAQTVLKPGRTNFNIRSILIGLQLQGNYSETGSYYLNVYWNASYIGGGTGNIKTICYLNCDPETDDCSPAKNVQNCSYNGSIGSAVCTILNPSYNFSDSGRTVNSVYCQFFDTQSGEVYVDAAGKPYFKKDFRPVAFNTWFSPITTVIGTEFNLQINVKNIGLFNDNYNVTASTDDSNILWINPLTAEIYIGPLKSDSYMSSPETGFGLVKLIVLTDEPRICITVNSTIKSDIGQTNCIQIKSKMASLPDFGLFGIIQIILLAGILVLVKF